MIQVLTYKQGPLLSKLQCKARSTHGSVTSDSLPLVLPILHGRTGSSWRSITLVIQSTGPATGIHVAFGFDYSAVCGDTHESEPDWLLGFPRHVKVK